MLILGISTSSKYPSAAVMRDGEIISFRIDKSGKSHSATLMEVIDSALSEAGAEKTDLDAVAVDVGPGSFTGVRIGVSCANAMAYALGIGVIPVSSLKALSALYPEEAAAASLIDCRNGNCYAALYENGEEKIAPCPAVISEFMEKLPENAVIAGDCLGRGDHPDAGLVLKCAFRDAASPLSEASPMYLRPSQAERMRKPDHAF